MRCLPSFRSATVRPALALIGGLLLFSAEAGANRVRRLALVVGANDGGPGRSELRHAMRDAEAMAQVLRRYGGLAADDLMLLRGASRARVEAGLTRLRAKVDSLRAGGQRVEVFFYYSGHSDETGLLLGDGAALPYARLREAMETLPAEVRVAVLDSCASGVLTRGKGGFRGPPFISDTATNVRGHAYVASASATEVAQESDRIRGSYFTHHLVAGLRGAADTDRDRRITLGEAYQYAFDATLSQTESTRSGPQHPNYDMRLSGSDGLVLTDLRQTSALLIVPGAVTGRIFVRDRDDHLVAEVHKPHRRPLSLGLEPGLYRVRVSSRERSRVGSFTVTSDRPTVVTQQALRDSALQTASHKGSSSSPVTARHLLSLGYVGLFGHQLRGQYEDARYQPAITWRFQSVLERQSAHGAELRYLHRLGPLYLGASGGFRRSRYRYEQQDALYMPSIPTWLRESGKSTELYALLCAQWHLPVWHWSRFFLWRWVHPVIGADIGGGYIRQTKESLYHQAPYPVDAFGPMAGPFESTKRRSLPAFYTRGRLGLTFTVTPRLWLDLFGYAGMEVSRRLIDEAQRRSFQVDKAGLVQPNLGLSAGVTVAL